jgi:xanthine dehydrogenase YagR molybdenum-binding subunit
VQLGRRASAGGHRGQADGTITAIGHEAWSGNLPGGVAEWSVRTTRVLYGGANRMAAQRLAVLDLPEGNAMRAPGEVPGMLALEVAMDEMAEKLGIDPVEFRIMNDTQVDPETPNRPFSARRLTECLRLGAERFNWNARSRTPGRVRDGQWLIGCGVAAAYRGNSILKSAARVILEPSGELAVETDMTDIGTGSYTVIAQTAAEMVGLSLNQVTVRLADSTYPVSAGSGGQWGANSVLSAVFAACTKLREDVARRLGLDPAQASFADGQVTANGRSLPLAQAAAGGAVTAEDTMTYGHLGARFVQGTFGAHFVEVAVNVVTAEPRVRRMLAVCAAGRIINPKLARNQVIGAMTMGVGSALMEELAVDTRQGFFVNHDLAG